MPLLFYRAEDDRPPSDWNTTRAAGFGALIGAVAAIFKLMAPWRVPPSGAVNVWVADITEVVGVALAFALLCVFAATLRNIVARRLIRHGRR